MSLLWFLSLRNATSPSCSNVGGERRIWHSLLTAAMDFLVARREAADARAARREALGDRVDEDRVLAPTSGNDMMLVASPSYMSSRYGSSEMMNRLCLSASLASPAISSSRVPDARRVGRVREEDRPRARRDQLLDLRHRREMEAILDPRRDRHDSVAVHHRVADVVRVERLRDQHLVARIARRLEGEAERLAAADRHDQTRRGRGGCPGRRSTRTSRRSSRRCPSPGCTTRRRPCVADALHERGRRRDVRLPDVQVVDGDAALLGGVGERGESSNRRPLQGLRAFGNAKLAQEPTPPKSRAVSPSSGPRPSSRCAGHCPWSAGTRPPERSANRRSAPCGSASGKPGERRGADARPPAAVAASIV